jgi:hypothetical protein
MTQNHSPMLELSEMNYWSKLFHSSQKLSVSQQRIAGGVACALPAVDILVFNRVLGAGISSLITEKDLDAFINFYTLAGSKRFFLQLYPFSLSEDVEDLLLRKGFLHHNNWAKLTRPFSTPVKPVINTDLQVRALQKSEALTYGKLIVKAFEWPDVLTDFFASSIGLQGYQHFFALSENKPVGAAALHIENDVASMAISGTLPESRGSGAQQLLLWHRLKEAERLGCTLAVSETGEDLPDKPNKSFRNMLKVGFEKAYVRKNYLFELR